MLTVKELKTLSELIKFFKDNEALIELINLTHLLNKEKDTSVLVLKELLLLGDIAEKMKKED